MVGERKIIFYLDVARTYGFQLQKLENAFIKSIFCNSTKSADNVVCHSSSQGEWKGHKTNRLCHSLFEDSCMYTHSYSSPCMMAILNMQHRFRLYYIDYTCPPTQETVFCDLSVPQTGVSLIFVSCFVKCIQYTFSKPISYALTHLRYVVYLINL